MTLTELRYVVAVAAERHFGRAAERCFVSQPSLSAAVKHLEHELGVQLFERTQGEILVTAAGSQVVALAEQVLAAAERVKAFAKTTADPLEGALRLGVIHTVAPYLLPALVAALSRRAPRMPLDLEENQTANLEALLKTGDIDAAVVALPFAPPGVDVLPLYDEAFAVIVPARHPWARRKQVAATELPAENLLLLPAGHCLRDQVLESCGAFAREPGAGRQGNSLETIRQMVASGLGVSVLPAGALTPAHQSKLVRRVPFAAPEPRRRIVLAYRRGFPRLAACRQIALAIAELDLPLQPLTNAAV
jgi:LysR family hydrogen peroxide-inducible transcriptional activator